MTRVQLALTLTALLFAQACHLTFATFDYGDAGPTDGGPDAGIDGGDAGPPPDAEFDAGFDAGCSEPLGTLENCTECGEQCGWACIAGSGCNDPIALALSDFHSCAIRQDGTAVCWGMNPGGHLGDGTTDDQLTPASVIDIRDAVEIATGWGVGDFHTCVRTSGGTVQCWGANLFGQVGDGTTRNRPSPVPVIGLSGVTSLSAGDFLSCAVSRGSVWCWGIDHGSTPTEVAGLVDITKVVVGGGHACALRSDGSVACWGRNDQGQVGDGTVTGPVTTPVDVGGLPEVIDLSVGGLHSCAITSSGSVRCWGQDHGVSPVAIPGIGVASTISVGYGHACATVGDMSVRCWGDNELGQLGNGSTTDSFAPVTVIGAAGATQVVAGGHHTCALVAGRVRCWGSGVAIGDGTTSMRTTPVDVVPVE